MDLYSLTKFLHVAFIIIWLGGGAVIVMLAARASRLNDTAEFAHVLKDVIFLSNRVFVPSSLAALVCGLIAAYLGGLFGQLWIILGLCGFALTFGVGIGVLKPRADKLGESMAHQGMTPALVDQGREILTVAEFDMIMLFVVVADMVVKPGIEDYVTLLIMAIVLLAAGYYFLGGLISPMFAKQKA